MGEFEIYLGNQGIRRCLFYLKKLNGIMKQMRSSQPDFDYKMAVVLAESLHTSGKSDELHLLLNLISENVPGYDDELIKRAQNYTMMIDQILNSPAQERILHAAANSINDNGDAETGS